MNKQGIRDQVKALMNRNDFTDALANTFIECLDGYVAYIVSNGGTMTYTLDGPGTWNAGTDTLVTITISDLPSEGGDIRHYSLLFITDTFSGRPAFEAVTRNALIAEGMSFTVPKLYTNQGVPNVAPTVADTNEGSAPSETGMT